MMTNSARQGRRLFQPICLKSRSKTPPPDHRAAEATHRLHAVDHAFVLFAERKHGQRVGRNILRRGGDEGDDDQRHDRIEVCVEIEESDGKDQCSVDQFGGKNPPFVISGRQGMAVDHRRPEEFQYPGQLDQLQEPDGR